MAQPFALMTRSTRHLSLPMRVRSSQRLTVSPAQQRLAYMNRNLNTTQHQRTCSSSPIRLLQTYHILSAGSRDRARGPSSQSPSTTTWLAQQQRSFKTSASKSQDGEGKSDKIPQLNATTPEKGKIASRIEASAAGQLLKRVTPPVLHENIYTIPNILTTTRIITAPIISYALLHYQPVLAFSLFAYSSITDLVDGYLARRYNSGTVLGSILDPFADKLLMTLTTITLYSIGTFPWWLALIILGRDGGLLLSALYFRWISLPPPKTMTRYWDFSLPSAEVRPTEISKINTLLQFLLVADAVLVPVLPVGLVESLNLWGVLEGWMGLVAGTTVWSGASYFFAKDAIRFIGEGDGGKKDREQGKQGQERK